MNPEKMKEIAKRAKESAPNREAVELAESFEDFASLLEGKEEIQDAGDMVLHFQKVQEAKANVQEKMGEVAASFGMSGDQLQRFFHNPANFSVAQWQEMESLKLGALNESSEGPSKKRPSHKRLKRSSAVKI